MVRLALLLLAAAPALAGWRIDQRAPALGEPVTLTLSARPGALDAIDLAPLARDFELHGRTLNRAGDDAQLTLTLYPLRAGRIALPALGLPGRPPVLTVLDHSDAVPRVRIEATTEPAIQYARQPFRLSLEACDDGSLDWQRPALATREGLVIRPLGEQQLDSRRDGEPCTAHRWHWALTPTAPGPVTLPLPMLEAVKFGERLRFPPPAARFEVRPVPAWLPPEAAVGPVAARAAPLPARVPVGRPLAWRIAVTGAYSPAALKSLMAAQLGPAFAAYAPVVAAPPPDGHAPTPALALTLYPRPDAAGTLVLPELKLPWYDPARGRLAAATVPGARIEVFDPARERLMRAGGMLAAVIALALAAWRMARALRWRLARRRCLASVAAADSPAALAAAVRAFSLDPAARPAATLGEARTRLGRPGLAAAIARLERVLYGGGHESTAELRAALARELGRCRPRQLDNPLPLAGEGRDGGAPG